MRLCIRRPIQLGLLLIAALLFGAVAGEGQVRTTQGPIVGGQPIRQPGTIQGPQYPVTQPGQPIGPSRPTIQQRPPAAQPGQPAYAPFRLTPQQQAALERVLVGWERSSGGVKTFECSFTRWEFDAQFPNPKNPGGAVAIEEGKIKYARPDQGYFSIGGDRPELWVCNGKSIIQHDYSQKQVFEFKVSPELQGKAIERTPLPFIFGAEVSKLKQRYFLRLTTTQEDVKHNRVCLEALPRSQADAANFSKAELLLSIKGDKLQPYAVQIYKPGGQQRDAYQFHHIKNNDPFFWVKNPFPMSTPRGWTRHVREAPTQQAARPPLGPARR